MILQMSYEQKLEKSLNNDSCTSEKVKTMIPFYNPLEVAKCEKCGKTTADPKELIRIVPHSEAEVPLRKTISFKATFTLRYLNNVE